VTSLLFDLPQNTKPTRKRPVRKNVRMLRCRIDRNDEFYTKLDEIEEECDHYAESFRGKNILCPCDTPDSNFVKYFETNFDKFGLKSLTGMGFNPEGNGIKYFKLPGKEPEISTLLLNGDYRSFEALKEIKEADIIITNPPFSLFRHFILMMFRFKKQFLLLGNMVTCGAKDMERLITSRRMWFGYFGQGAMEFILASHYASHKRSEIADDGSLIKYAKVSSICWATNLPVHKQRGYPLPAKYDPAVYKKYDNYDALEVPALISLPYDYDGVMGVPITFVANWDPEQFDIIGFSGGTVQGIPCVEGEYMFRRVYIKKRPDYKGPFSKPHDSVTQNNAELDNAESANNTA